MKTKLCTRIHADLDLDLTADVPVPSIPSGAHPAASALRLPGQIPEHQTPHEKEVLSHGNLYGRGDS